MATLEPIIARSLDWVIPSSLGTGLGLKVAEWIGKEKA